MEWKIHHVAVIASDLAASRRFYVDLLGLPVLRETCLLYTSRCV